jgi:hypothetical protein
MDSWNSVKEFRIDIRNSIVKEFRMDIRNSVVSEQRRQRGKEVPDRYPEQRCIWNSAYSVVKGFRMDIWNSAYSVVKGFRMDIRNSVVSEQRGIWNSGR